MSKFKVGDKVRITCSHVWGEELGNVGVVSSLVGAYSYVVTREEDVEKYGDGFHYPAQDLELIEEEAVMKLWKDMTPEDKGALLLAYHEGKLIEFSDGCGWERIPKPSWANAFAYRVKPNPVVHKFHVGKSENTNWIPSIQRCPVDTHKITFEVVDGEPDVTSIKMEKL